MALYDVEHDLLEPNDVANDHRYRILTERFWKNLGNIVS